MKKTLSILTVSLLGLALCLFAASNASAARPYGWYYAGYGPAFVPAYGYGYGVVVAPYGYAYNPRKAYRQAIRYGYVPPVAVVPAPVYAYPPYYAPYYGPTRGPRDYFYQPGYQRPSPAVVPAPVPAPAPMMPNIQPAPAVPGPELIPAPLAE